MVSQHMNESQIENFNKQNKPDSKRSHTVWLHSNELQKQSKLPISDRNKNSSFFGVGYIQRKLVWESYRVLKILYLYQGNDYMCVHTNYKWDIQ